MAESLIEIHGSVEHIVFKNESNQYTVLEMNTQGQLITVVGTFPFVSEGEELHVFGTWSSHPVFGEQFKAEMFERSRPATAAAMLKYLSSGAVKGIGPATARRIVDTFGEQALDIIENDPKRLTQIKGISAAKAMEMSKELKRVYGIRELMMYLGAFGVSPEQVVPVWKQYGEASTSCIQEDPYCLCHENIGISFTVADKIAESMEKAKEDRGRIRAGVLYVLRHNLDNGHSCLPCDKLCEAAVRLLDVPLDNVQDAVYTLCQDMETICENFGGKDFIFLKKQHIYESHAASVIKTMLLMPPSPVLDIDEKIYSVEAEQGFTYAEKQREAIRAALEKGVLILTGGPGTGKTTTLNAIIHILKQSGEKVILAAPTGRAAKRMSELTGEEAKTIHRMLQVGWDEQDNPVFNRNERNPLDCDCLVIDELSMVDSYVFDSVLRALPMACRLILVGDSDQLPSIGPGNILGDMIASGLFPTVQLREIFRQSMQSLIVTNAHAIVNGEMPDISRRDSDFFFLAYSDSEKIADTVVSLCSARLPDSYGYSSISDIQVLCPGRKGELGTVELNNRLRESINPPGKDKPEVKIGSNLFRLGDKVMHIRNDYDLIWTRDDDTSGQGVFNGDMGTVVFIDRAGGMLHVRIDDKTVLYDFEKAGFELEPAYAITVHKSQGNEFNAVIMPLLNIPEQLKYRNLLYTGITRAKQLLILTGHPSVMAQMIENDKKTRRYTGLLKFLTDGEDTDKILPADR